MKIAIIANPYVPIPPAAYGGTELVILNLIRGLQEQGHEPILLGTGDSKVDCPLVPIVDEAIYFPPETTGLPAFHKKIREVNKRTKQIIKETLPEVDVIHSHGFDIQDFADFPHIFTLHVRFVFAEIQFYLERKDLNYVSISNNQREACPELNYVGTVYNGEDPGLFPIVAEPDDYVCFLGRFDPDKSPHLAIQLAINNGIKIKVAGKIDFEGYDYFNKEVKPLLKNPLVEYLGELNFKDKVKLISKAKCNLHPTSFREPFGLTVIEAAYCGTPTLAIERGSMPELIQDGFTGKLVEDFMEGSFQLKECYEMDRQYIARRTRRVFNYKKMTRGYIKAYKKVMK